MNKVELVAALAEKSGLSKTDASRALDGILECMSEALKQGDDVRLVGFGTFSVTKRAATTGRNPRTGETIKIAASKSPKFSAGKGLKDLINA